MTGLVHTMKATPMHSTPYSHYHTLPTYPLLTLLSIFPLPPPHRPPHTPTSHTHTTHTHLTHPHPPYTPIPTSHTPTHPTHPPTSHTHTHLTHPYPPHTPSPTSHTHPHLTHLHSPHTHTHLTHPSHTPIPYTHSPRTTLTSGCSCCSVKMTRSLPTSKPGTILSRTSLRQRMPCTQRQ